MCLYMQYSTYMRMFLAMFVIAKGGKRLSVYQQDESPVADSYSGVLYSRQGMILNYNMLNLKV